MSVVVRCGSMSFARVLTVVCAAAFLRVGTTAEITNIWLTPTSDRPLKVAVSWETKVPSDSEVEFGATTALGQRVAVAEEVPLHHVEITLPRSDAAWHYRVRSGSDCSPIYSFQPAESNMLRVAVVGNLANPQPWGEAVLLERPHLLLSAGDNVPQLHDGRPVAPDTTAAYSRLIARYPELFRTTLFLPVLGNHDKEVRPRGPKPPAEPVYDVAAQAYRKFFALPGDEWKWRFDVPEFGLRLVALDLNHVSDTGTTWQSCHDFHTNSAQFLWYKDAIARSPQPRLITIYNERHSAVRGLGGGAWWRLISSGSLAVTGFGHFAERAEIDGVPCYNTSVKGTGDRYPDPKSVVLKSDDNFLLLTLRSTIPLTAELRNLKGEPLDTKRINPRTETRPTGN